MLQGEDSRGSGGCYKIINCDVFKPIAEPHSARLRDWMERLEINTHISTWERLEQSDSLVKQAGRSRVGLRDKL